jgi:D-amino peptidase
MQKPANRHRSTSPWAHLTHAWLAIGVSLTHASPVTAGPATAFKVYISVDMEGVAGAVTSDQLRPSGFEYERFRKVMTDETLAAVRAAHEAGATGIVVSDAHGNGENLLIELFPADVKIVRSSPRHGSMMAGLDASFSAALFIGYHASATSMSGVLAHTMSGAHFTRVALNGTPVSEAEFNAAYAGDLNVPVVFASGDDVAMSEVTARLGAMETVATKTALGFRAAATLTPAAACDLIHRGVLSALAHRERRHPYKMPHPVTLDVSLKNYLAVEMLTYLRSVTRTDSHSIRFLGQDMLEVSDFLDFIDGYSPDMAP